MPVRSLSSMDPMGFRSIIFHGKNSMTDMNLMMIGSTPLSEVKPKQVREEVAYADGDLDLSRVDGGLYFENREITYTFALVYDYSDDTQDGSTQLSRNVLIANQLTAIYKWLYQDFVDYTIPHDDAVPIVGPTQRAYNCHVYKDEMYDYAYGQYKFMKASVTEVKPGKVMFNGSWLETVEVTFTCDPYLQTLYGDRIELATFVDRSVSSSANIQTRMFIYTNNRYFLNDYERWFSDDCGLHVTDNIWRFRIRVPYSGVIGLYISPSSTWNGVTYTISSVTGQTTTLYFLDNSQPGETITTHAGGYCYTTPTADPNGYNIIDFSVTFTDAWDTEHPPHIYIIWGVLRSYSVEDQSHYIVDAYSNSGSATMYVGDGGGSYHTQAFSTTFSLTTRPLNDIHIRNLEYDGMYKFRYDSTTRRL